MPTTRRKIVPTRIGGYLTDDQRLLLETGFCFWYRGSPEPPPFRDDAEMRQAWRVHGARLLAEWRRPWTRPRAFWLYDAGVKWDKSSGRWIWPRGIRTEEQMVRKLLRAGQLAPVPAERADAVGMPIGVRQRLTSAR